MYITLHLSLYRTSKSIPEDNVHLEFPRYWGNKHRVCIFPSNHYLFSYLTSALCIYKLKRACFPCNLLTRGTAQHSTTGWACLSSYISFLSRCPFLDMPFHHLPCLHDYFIQSYHAFSSRLCLEILNARARMNMRYSFLRPCLVLILGLVVGSTAILEFTNPSLELLTAGAPFNVTWSGANGTTTLRLQNGTSSSGIVTVNTVACTSSFFPLLYFPFISHTNTIAQLA